MNSRIYTLCQLTRLSLKRWPLLLALLMIPLCLRATVWSADNLQMVHLQDYNRYVCDPDGVLSQAARDSADLYLRKLHVNCGIQTVFVVVRKVKGGDTFRMAQDLGNKYGVGTKKERRGLVVVVATEDRRYTIAPGMGLEADLTDVECDDIARACIVKNMKVNQADQMVVETVRALYNKFKNGNTGITSTGTEETSDDFMMALFILLLFMGWPTWKLVKLLLVSLGVMKKPKKTNSHHRRHDDDNWMPPFIFGGGGGFGSGRSVGGSFGGGSFGGGGASGGW